MITDALLIISGGISAANAITYQTVTGASAVLSTNSVDLSAARDMGEGEDVYLRLLVGTAFAGLTALTIDIIIADDAALTSNVEVVGSLGAAPVASLTAGARFACEINPKIASVGRRYLGARYTPTGTGTAGTLYADFGLDVPDGRKTYPSSFSVI